MDRTAREFWTFRRGVWTLLLLSAWAPLVGYLARGLRDAEPELGGGFGLLFRLLPLFLIPAFAPRFLTQLGRPRHWLKRRAAGPALAIVAWFFLAPSVQSLLAGDSPAGARLALAIALFFAILPIFASLAFRPWYVFEFFRSVRVGVVNLVLIGLGSILGVLFYQEDADFPLPDGAVASLVEWVDTGSTEPWGADQFFAYDMYASVSGRRAGFRNAQAFFAYRLAEGLKLDGFFGLDDELEIDREGIDERLAPLRERLPELEARFGTDFAIALASQSETGLLTQARDRRIQAVETKFDDFWWTLFVWADRLDLIRAYKSDWFAMYWAILFCGVLVNTFRAGWRRNLRPSRWGFVVTHLGVMMICFGGLWSRMHEQRGILELNVGRAADVWETWGGESRGFHGQSTGRGEPPFAVRLTGFRADHHDVLSVNYLITAEDGSQNFEYQLDQQPEERLWKGKVLRYDRPFGEGGPSGDPQLRIEVLDKVEQSIMDTRLKAAEAGQVGHPMARLAIQDADGHTLQEVPLAAALQVPLVHAPSGSRVLLAVAEDEAQARAALAEPPAERWGILRRDTADSAHRFHDVVPGAVFEEELADGIYTVEVLEAQPFLKIQEVNASEIVPAPLDREIAYLPPRNPAVHLQITAPDGRVETRWVMATDTGNHLKVEFDQLRYSFLWDDWRAPAQQRYLLVTLADGSLRWGEVGQPDSLRLIEEGATVPLPTGFAGQQEQIQILQALPNASLAPEYLQKPGIDFFDDSPAAVHLAITTPGPSGPSTETIWLRTREGRDRTIVRYTAADGSPREAVLLFREQSEQLPIEWQSRLQILAEDPTTQNWTPVAEDTIRVNDYLHHKGYRFFQTNHDPRDPTYSGIGVVYDPGIPWVLTGYYLVMFGTAVVFLIKPLVTRRHRSL